MRTLASKRVNALTRSPASVTTTRQVACERSAAWITDVRAECRLAVGPGLDEAVGATVAEGDGGEESRRLLDAVVLERHRRHRHGDVVGEQGHERVDVAGLVGAGEAVDELALLGRARTWRQFVFCGWGEPLPDDGPRPLEGARHGLLARVEDGGDLAGAVAEDVAQDEDSSLTRRERLECREERDRDRFARLVAAFGSGRLVGPTEERVGVGLEPDHLAGAARLRYLNAGGQQVHDRPSPLGAQDVQTPARCHLVQPRPQ